MDPSRFDRLTRALAGATGRRGALAGLFGGVLLPLAHVLPDGEADAKDRRRHRSASTAKDRDQAQERRSEPSGGSGPGAEQCVANGQRCGKGSGKRGKACPKCCSRFTISDAKGKSRCSCKPEGTAADNAAQCCSGRVSAGGFCGACDPGLTECPAGCVDTETDDDNCGGCRRACATGQACASGSCVCTEASCGGCCDGTTCRTGDTSANCGKNGEECQTCTEPDTCGGGNPGSPGVCGCTADSDATTCAGKCGTVQNNCGQNVNCTALCAGCCAGAVCQPGSSEGACGAGGANCTACPVDSTCTSGSCCTTAGNTATAAAPCCAGLNRCAGDVCKTGDCCAGVTCPDGQECSGGACAVRPNCTPFRGNCVNGFGCCSGVCGGGGFGCNCSRQGTNCFSSNECCKNPVATAICVGFVCVP